MGQESIVLNSEVITEPWQGQCLCLELDDTDEKASTVCLQWAHVLQKKERHPPCSSSYGSHICTLLQEEAKRSTWCAAAGAPVLMG
jgi:hypothetical protein